MRPTISEIVQATAMRFGVATHEIIGGNARKVYARPRQVAMYLARELTSYSTPQIGRAFDRDHTTVLYACKTVDRLALRESELADNLTSARAIAVRLADMRGYRVREALRRPLTEIRVSGSAL